MTVKIDNNRILLKPFNIFVYFMISVLAITVGFPIVLILLLALLFSDSTSSDESAGDLFVLPFQIWWFMLNACLRVISGTLETVEISTKGLSFYSRKNGANSISWDMIERIEVKLDSNKEIKDNLITIILATSSKIVIDLTYYKIFGINGLYQVIKSQYRPFLEKLVEQVSNN